MTAHPIVDIENCLHHRGSGRDRFSVFIERLSVAPGEQLALVGPSGCGKSTVLDLLALVLRPTEVQRFELRTPGNGATDIAGLWRREARDQLTRLRAAGIGYVLQTGGMIPFLSIRENMLLTHRLLGRRHPDACDALLNELEIGGLGHRLPRQVSIGQRQRAAIARALASSPPLILADEPTASLDPATAEVTMALLTTVARQHDAALIVVTHDRAMAERHALTVVNCDQHVQGSTIYYRAGAALSPEGPR